MMGRHDRVRGPRPSVRSGVHEEPGVSGSRLEGLEFIRATKVGLGTVRQVTRIKRWRHAEMVLRSEYSVASRPVASCPQGDTGRRSVGTRIYDNMRG